MCFFVSTNKSPNFIISGRKWTHWGWLQGRRKAVVLTLLKWPRAVQWRKKKWLSGVRSASANTLGNGCKNPSPLFSNLNILCIWSLSCLLPAHGFCAVTWGLMGKVPSFIQSKVKMIPLHRDKTFSYNGLNITSCTGKEEYLLFKYFILILYWLHSSYCST